MLEALVAVANFLKSTFYYVLYCSYKTGNVLVTSLSALLQYFIALSSSGLTFCAVLYESLAIFLQDNVQYLQQALVFVQAVFDAIYKSAVAIMQFGGTIINLIVSLHATLYSGITATFTAIVHLIIFLKRLFILFGSGVWFLITFLPLLLYYFCLSFVTLINVSYREIWSLCTSGVSSVITLVKSIMLFILDVPLESMAGLLIAISIAFVIAQCYVMLTSYFKQKLRMFQLWYRRQKAPRINHHRSRPINKSPEDNDKCCVICQERIKRVLLLPCRHLCLCTECTRELRYYDETCPICRTNIDSTMQVYV